MDLFIYIYRTFLKHILGFTFIHHIRTGTIELKLLRYPKRLLAEATAANPSEDAIDICEPLKVTEINYCAQFDLIKSSLL